MVFTYTELRMQMICVVKNLNKFNFTKSDIFAVMSRNNHELAPIIFALLATSHPINTLDTSYKESEIIHMLSTTKPKAIFCELDVVERMKCSLRRINIDAIIFTFGGSVDGTIPISTLSVENCEEYFV